MEIQSNLTERLDREKREAVGHPGKNASQFNPEPQHSRP